MCEGIKAPFQPNINAAFWVVRRGQRVGVGLLAVTRGSGTDLHHPRLAAEAKCAPRSCTCRKYKLRSAAQVGVKSLVSRCTGSICASSSVLLEFEAFERPQKLNLSLTVMGFCSLNIVVMFLLVCRILWENKHQYFQEERTYLTLMV